MLSNQQQQPQPAQAQPSRPLARRLIKHERQRSTPITPIIQVESAGLLPERYTRGITRQQRPAQIHHRRGLSLDPSMRFQDLRLTHTRSPLGTNSGTVNTNQGPLYQQQKMREAQMHGTTRPGHFDQGLGNIMENSRITNPTQASFDGMQTPDDCYAYCFETGMPSSGMASSGMTNTERSQSRPYTPNSMTMSVTPTPYSNLPNAQDLSFTQSSPIRHGSIDLGIQQFPAHAIMTRGGSYQGQLMMKRSDSQNSAPSTMMHGNMFRSSQLFAPSPVSPLDFTNMVNLDFEQHGYRGYESSNYSPTQTSPAASSMRASPDLPPVALFGELPGGFPYLPASEDMSLPPSPTKSRSSSPRKKVAPLPEEMIIEETGITLEQVDAFIQGPDAQTNKFSCLFDGCTMKPFGRKENIRAHVQTHLGDRKYVCTVCDNRFVRPNDLKRHAIIHQEVKEFVCKCGSAFGRQDALRRHRIRKPFCVDGDPTLELMRKEEKKRGRPRKIAPTETTERRERKETIRKQVMEQKRKGSLPRSVASTSKSGRSCSPDDVQNSSGVSAYSPTNMSLTPPMSPVSQNQMLNVNQPYSNLETSVARLSLSPPPTHVSGSRRLSQEFGIGADSPFGPDHFNEVPFSGPATPAQTSYGTPPELELSSSPITSKFTMDFSEAEMPPSSTTSVHDLGTITTTSNFSDEFLSDSVLMDQMLKDCTQGALHEGIRNESLEDIERFLMLDQM